MADPLARLTAFVQRLAELKTCREDPEHCDGDSGPYCATHDWPFGDSDIHEAREIVAEVAAPSLAAIVNACESIVTPTAFNHGYRNGGAIDAD